MMRPHGFDARLFQCAWVVDDIQTAISHWIDVRGVGPFFLSPHVRSQRGCHRGAPAWFEISAGIAQAGTVQIELIQQHAATCPLFRDPADLPGDSPHHIGVVVSDLDAVIGQYAVRGVPVHFEDWFGETRYVFIDTRPEHGYMTEYVQSTAAFDQVRAMIRDAATHWTGDAPIRSLAPPL
jgi:hypothetical protein